MEWQAFEKTWKQETNVWLSGLDGLTTLHSWIPHTNELTQGCGVGLAVKLSPFIDITLFDTQTKEKIEVFAED